MHEPLSRFYEQLREQRIVLAFLGVFSQEIMVECRKILTDRQEIDKNRLLVLTSVFVELTENILKYSAERQLRDGRLRGVGIVVVQETEEAFTVHSGNLAELSAGQKLVAHCEELKKLDQEGLRARYRSQRREIRPEDAKGAGLGLIEIARRASGPVICSAEPVGDSQCFVSMKIHIAK